MSNYLFYLFFLIVGCASDEVPKDVNGQVRAIKQQNDLASEFHNQDKLLCDSRLLKFIREIDSACKSSDFQSKSVVQTRFLDTNKITLYFKGSRILRMDSFLYGDNGLSDRISSYYFDNDNKLVGTRSEYGNNSNRFSWYYELNSTSNMLLALDVSNKCIESKNQKLTEDRINLEIGRSSYLTYLYLRLFPEFKFNTIQITSDQLSVIEVYEKISVFSDINLTSKKMFEVSPKDKVIYLGSKYSISNNNERQIWNKIKIGKHVGWILDDQSKVSLSSDLW